MYTINMKMGVSCQCQKTESQTNFMMSEHKVRHIDPTTHKWKSKLYMHALKINPIIIHVIQSLLPFDIFKCLLYTECCKQFSHKQYPMQRLSPNDGGKAEHCHSWFHFFYSLVYSLLTFWSANFCDTPISCII